MQKDPNRSACRAEITHHQDINYSQIGNRSCSEPRTLVIHESETEVTLYTQESEAEVTLYTHESEAEVIL